MPMISFSQKELLRGTVLEPGWYLMHIEGIGEKPSSAGDSINYPVEATVIKNADTGDKKFENVPLTWNFNSKAIGFVVGFLKALGIDVAPGERIELSALAGKDITVYVEPKEYDNRLVNNVTHKYKPAIQ